MILQQPGDVVDLLVEYGEEMIPIYKRYALKQKLCEIPLDLIEEAKKTSFDSVDQFVLQHLRAQNISLSLGCKLIYFQRYPTMDIWEGEAVGNHVLVDLELSIDRNYLAQIKNFINQHATEQNRNPHAVTYKITAIEAHPNAIATIKADFTDGDMYFEKNETPFFQYCGYTISLVENPEMSEGAVRFWTEAEG